LNEASSFRMTRFSTEAKVGLFFIISAAVLVYVWFNVLDFGKKEGFILKARFKSVEGLVKDAQVQIAGIRVGKVKNIILDSESGKAVTLLEINGAYRNAIPEDSKVFLRTKGLLGDRYIVIEPGKPNVRKLKPGEEIAQVYEPYDPEKLVENVGIMTQDLQILARDARKVLIDEKGSERIASVLKNSDDVFRNLNDLVKRNKEKINQTVDNANDATKRLDDIVVRNQDKLSRTLENFNKSSQSLNKSSKDIEAVAADVRAGRGTLGRLVVDETLYRDTSTLVRDLRNVTNRVQYGPGAISRLINDPDIYFEARRAIRNMSKTAEDVSEATPISTLAIILGSVFR
jgi:phospholipid/cholesterol/gamma-HCH transport system substrate-binding protein